MMGSGILSTTVAPRGNDNRSRLSGTHVATGLLAAAWRLNGDARCETIIEALRSRPVYGTALALAIFHLVGAEIGAAADWTAKVIAERHAAVFFFLYAHADALRRSPRWPALARLLNLPAGHPRGV